MKRIGFGLSAGIIFALGCGGGVQHDATEPDAKPPVEQTQVEKAQAVEPSVEKAVPVEKAETQVPKDAPSQDAVVQGNTAFALDMYRQVGAEDGNLFFSPYSLSTALAMTYGGARGKTEKQIAYAMHFAHPQGKIHERFMALQGEFGKVEDVKLNIANALWPADKFTFKDEYLGLIKENYDTPVTLLDYENDLKKSRKTINKWAKKKTEGKIKELIEKGILDKMTRLVLTNAIDFKGQWHTKFDKKKTKKLPFNVSADESVKVKMMYLKHKFNFFEDDSVQLLEIPYKGNQISMLVVLPKKADGLADVEKDLNGEKLAQWVGGLQPTKLDLYFPRFEINSAFSLEEQLKALGVFDAFDGVVADFTGMADPAEMKEKGNLFISAVIHKAFTQVNEKGTEAAAATAVVMRSYSAVMREFRADHPFMFLIRDTKTGTIFFAGRITNPKKK